MADTALTAPRSQAAPILFATAVFTSAALVFMVEPMVARLILPKLGGSAAVWNTAMVFFQAALLLGYGYAHLLQRVASLRAQVLIHLLVLAAAGLFLPLRVSGLFGDPWPGMPVGWLLAVLAVSVGAPFAALSATAPLLQAWYARARAGEADADNPYALYVASNLGSFAALLSYPALIEPVLQLHVQRVAWSLGYLLFALLILGVLAATRQAAVRFEAPALEKGPAITWRERAIWVLLAAAPSSLMLGVTAYLTTDVASAPFLWVIPLALYLLTFVFAFQTKPWLPRGVVLTAQAGLAALCVGVLPFEHLNWAFLFALHLSTFFFTALMCHQALAARRPGAGRLTEFYFWLSLGGVLGGVFNALIAPVVFEVVREYPIVLVLAALARPWDRNKPGLSAWSWGGLIALALACGVPVIAMAWLKADPQRAIAVPYDRVVVLAHVLFTLASFVAFAMVRNRFWLFVAALAVISFAAHDIAGRYNWIASERSFFGVLRMAWFQDGRIGRVRTLVHGTTLHGAEAVDPRWRCHPMLYYAPTTSIGRAVTTVQSRAPGVEIGVVGLGTGALASYVRPQDRLTYFEIDPKVAHFALNPDRFDYVTRCARGPVGLVMGDARLSMAKQPAGRFDILVVDAFSSDSVPVHLLTEEALKGYLRVLKPHGVVLLHLSNRNLEITTPAAATARAVGAPALHGIYVEDPKAPTFWEASTEVLLVGRSSTSLNDFRGDPMWRDPPKSDTRPWTDDYINLPGALWRDMQADLKSSERR